ncbi:hypothetical protein CYLTODRAFT_452851 [Cylindrobasidium torrendii FP15055 ss-10]|uniref:DNA replication regulator SLD2 n=1 Tax=Cylindrobasidium torrendii FP15055 ss-10 TaxID=1314674 RepID=A0A0D7BG03_9AGAR|nr:hypothetical protein CYLTODRAFT_452851 [Cylindrobasidium torrendii FP15055 ss-10]
MSDAVALKKEIKAWEHEFKAKHGRGPKVPDIKANPVIENKYKELKRLSKAISSAPSIPTKRAAEPGPAPLNSFNPFSPQKERRTRNLELSPGKVEPIFNPFATPSRPKGRPSIFHSPDASPEPPSPTPRAKSQTLFTRSTTTPKLPSPISRARKRLRGEAVSPSPVKEKRRRLSSEPPPSPSVPSSVAGDDDDDLFSEVPASSSFIEDSPVKGSSFRLLFDESSNKDLKKKLFPSDTDTFSAPTIFGGSTARTTLSRTMSQRSSVDRDASSSQSSRKRAFSVDSDVVEDSDAPATDTLVLVPPSPPTAAESSKRIQGPYKGKGKVGDRKKAKVVAMQEDSEDEDMDSSRVRVVGHSIAQGSAHPRHDSDDDELIHLRSQRGRVENGDDSSVEDEHLEVDLPNQLKQVLAFSPDNSKAREKEERVIDGLLYGRRTEHYDASRGGEIWGIGEQDGAEIDDEEGDWEGEPVPWEVGEL